MLFYSFPSLGGSFLLLDPGDFGYPSAPQKPFAGSRIDRFRRKLILNGQPFPQDRLR
jgi:hypothetical protein